MHDTGLNGPRHCILPSVFKHLVIEMRVCVNKYHSCMPVN